MMVNGVHMPNTTCARCHFRHPPQLSCREASLQAARNLRVEIPCLGCGGPTDDDGNCPRCEVEAEELIRYSHWPLEVSLTPSALTEVQVALEQYLNRFDPGGSVGIELSNLLSNIRSHIQHLAAEKRSRKAAPAKDPLLL